MFERDLKSIKNMADDNIDRRYLEKNFKAKFGDGKCLEYLSAFLPDEITKRKAV